MWKYLKRIAKNLSFSLFLIVAMALPTPVSADSAVPGTAVRERGAAQGAPADGADVAQLRRELDDARRSATIWRTALVVVTLIYIFVYVMGRRRLMRKIWKRNRQLRSALEHADETDRMKTAFIRSMSHEIRTPLNAINGFSQLLCSPDFELSESERLDMKDRISASVDTITLIINELLELAQGETQPPMHDDVSPNEVGRAVLEASRLQDTKGLVLSFETDVDDALTVRSNRELVSQILVKLMDNALKFTDAGRVSMSVGRQGDMLQIAVTDTGIGIPADKQAAVFENFVKLNDYRDGVGLGLPICRRLARSLGGNIVIDPDYKNGSRFVLQLPCG